MNSQIAMLLKECVSALLVFTLACVSTGVSAAAKDHPLLSGMPGYVIDSHKNTVFGSFDRSLFYCGPSRKCNSSDAGFGSEGNLIAEGEVTTLRYETKADGQTLAVLRNYESAIKSIGGRKVNWMDGHEGKHVFLVERGGRRIWVVLENVHVRYYDLTYIEEKPVQQVVTAKQLADAINIQGFATLYINFENNSAAIKPETKTAINEITALMTKDSSLRLSIEGHTDNVGNARANKKLSQDRAASVVKVLTEARIESKRLQAKGWGSEVPIADNRTDDGRAINRRVELVKVK